MFKQKMSHQRIQQNNKWYRILDSMLGTLRDLIRDGYTVNKCTIDGKSIPIITLQNCPHCKKLGGSIFKTQKKHGKFLYTYQKMMNGCRVEWQRQSDKKLNPKKGQNNDR